MQEEIRFATFNTYNLAPPGMRWSSSGKSFVLPPTHFTTGDACTSWTCGAARCVRATL